MFSQMKTFNCMLLGYWGVEIRNSNYTKEDGPLRGSLCINVIFKTSKRLLVYKKSEFFLHKEHAW